MWIYAHHSLSFGWFVIVIVASLPDWDENRKCKPNVKHRGYNWCFDFTIDKNLNCNVYGTESTQLTPSYHNDPKSEFKYFFFCFNYHQFTSWLAKYDRQSINSSPKSNACPIQISAEKLKSGPNHNCLFKTQSFAIWICPTNHSTSIHSNNNVL